jgi:hypothetical protein
MYLLGRYLPMGCFSHHVTLLSNIVDRSLSFPSSFILHFLHLPTGLKTGVLYSTQNSMQVPTSDICTQYNLKFKLKMYIKNLFFKNLLKLVNILNICQLHKNSGWIPDIYDRTVFQFPDLHSEHRIFK